jgi:hypothetical protein
MRQQMEAKGPVARIEIGLLIARQGGMAVPAVWRLINYARVHRTQTARQSSQAGRPVLLSQNPKANCFWYND